MSKKVIYISDFFIEECLGGAELSDNVFVEFLRENDVNIQKIKSRNFNYASHNADVYVVSNFAFLSPENKKLLSTGGRTYFIIERDQKYVRSRNTAEYPNFIAPKSEVVNRDFYKGAKKVFCLTGKQMEIMNKHVELDNLVSLGCTQFSKTQLSILSENIETKKNEKFAIMKGKRWDKAIAVCERDGIKYDVLEKQDYPNFIKTLSGYKGIVFFSHAFESCCRLLIEARILNLSIVTDGRNGCTYEDWFGKHKGRQLLDFIENKTMETMNTMLGYINAD